jgi:hypothetical protein
VDANKIVGIRTLKGDRIDAKEFRIRLVVDPVLGIVSS